MWFDKETFSIIVECIQLMPSEMVNSGSNAPICELELLKLYGLDTEVSMLKIKWTKMPSEAKGLDTPEKVLRHTDKDFYPLSSLLQVL